MKKNSMTNNKLMKTEKFKKSRALFGIVGKKR